MTQLERRFDHRIPFETFLTTYVRDRPARGFTVNISETGLFLNTLPGTVLRPEMNVGLELELPGLPESIWVAGRLCHDQPDDYFAGRGVKFLAMAERHARMIREFCYRRRVSQFRRRLFAA